MRKTSHGTSQLCAYSSRSILALCRLFLPASWKIDQDQREKCCVPQFRNCPEDRMRNVQITLHQLAVSDKGFMPSLGDIKNAGKKIGNVFYKKVWKCYNYCVGYSVHSWTLDTHFARGACCSSEQSVLTGFFIVESTKAREYGMMRHDSLVPCMYTLHTGCSLH